VGLPRLLAFIEGTYAKNSLKNKAARCTADGQAVYCHPKPILTINCLESDRLFIPPRILKQIKQKEKSWMNYISAIVAGIDCTKDFT